ncbi:MAG: hypothetical protein JSS82_00075 [Bacteroidetes bacterium]|nr:hypothetical protein [Bacteroidota bacterium]
MLGGIMTDFHDPLKNIDYIRLFWQQYTPELKKPVRDRLVCSMDVVCSRMSKIYGPTIVDFSYDKSESTFSMLLKFNDNNLEHQKKLENVNPETITISMNDFRSYVDDWMKLYIVWTVVSGNMEHLPTTISHEASILSEFKVVLHSANFLWFYQLIR